MTTFEMSLPGALQRNADVRKAEISEADAVAGGLGLREQIGVEKFDNMRRRQELFGEGRFPRAVWSRDQVDDGLSLRSHTASIYMLANASTRMSKRGITFCDT